MLYYVTQFVWHSNLHSWSNESTCPLRSLSLSPSTKTREERGCAYAHWLTWEHCCHLQLYQSLLKSTRRLSSKFWHSLVEPLTSASSLGVTTLFYMYVAVQPSPLHLNIHKLCHTTAVFTTDLWDWSKEWKTACTETHSVEKGCSDVVQVSQQGEETPLLLVVPDLEGGKGKGGRKRGRQRGKERKGDSRSR